MWIRKERKRGEEERRRGARCAEVSSLLLKEPRRPLHRGISLPSSGRTQVPLRRGTSSPLRESPGTSAQRYYSFPKREPRYLCVEVSSSSLGRAQVPLRRGTTLLLRRAQVPLRRGILHPP